MTKKEQKLFERVLSMNNGDVDKIDGVYRFNNFYYATNGVMAVRTLDEPKSPMVPDEVQTSDESLYKRVEEIFEDSIIHGKPIELPTKKELVEVRKNLADFDFAVCDEQCVAECYCVFSGQPSKEFLLDKTEYFYMAILETVFEGCSFSATEHLV